MIKNIICSHQTIEISLDPYVSEVPLSRGREKEGGWVGRREGEKRKEEGWVGGKEGGC